jgi:carbamate kinase
MKVCGVELKGNDAVICLMSLDEGLYTLNECRVKKLSIIDAKDQQQIQKFQFDFAKLIADYQVEKVTIKERLTRGKFAGGSVSFKLEATVQLIENLDVSLLASSKIKDIIKNSQTTINFKDTGLKQFQEQAFMTAFAYLDSQ